MGGIYASLWTLQADAARPAPHTDMTTTVLVQKNWRTPDLLRQTPGRSGVWDGIRFVMEPVGIAVPLPPSSTCRAARHDWSAARTRLGHHAGAAQQGLPPHAPRQTPIPSSLYPAPRLTGRKYITTQPAIAWHVDRDYDFLQNCPSPHKTAATSCITSARPISAGTWSRPKCRGGKYRKPSRDSFCSAQFPRDRRQVGWPRPLPVFNGNRELPQRLVLEQENRPTAFSLDNADLHGYPRIAEYFPAESW